MKDTRKYTVYPSQLDVCAAFKKTGEYLKQCGYKEQTENTGNCITFTLTLGENRMLRAYTFDGFTQLLAEYPYAMPIWTHSHWEKKDSFVVLDIDIRSSGLEIGVASSDLNTVSGLHDRLAQVFQASNPSPEKSPTVSRYGLKKSVFLAHRFDETGKDLAWKLGTFLRRLGFDVVEGEGYETRDIPEKVTHRIESQDVFVCLVSAGDHSWVLSEAAYAKGRNKYIIILCQEGVAFNKGIVGGDYEHLTFPKEQIEATYSDLLYALPG